MEICNIINNLNKTGTNHSNPARGYQYYYADSIQSSVCECACNSPNARANECAGINNAPIKSKKVSINECVCVIKD